MSSNELIDISVINALAERETEAGSTLKLLDAFAADARRTLARMRDVARRGDSGMLAFEAHRLKGNSAAIGARRLAAECLALERSARDRKLDVAPQIDFALAVLDSTQISFSCLSLGGKLA